MPKQKKAAYRFCTEIKEIRPMTKEEMDAEGWYGDRPPSVIELADGTKLYPSRDSEGNGPGCLFGVTPKGEHFGLR
ncbi:MAG TPA: hypothetical protein P5136_01400 [Methanofastidiosum sp.]|nr:hypothetical protein [Methanofastidiosum sp.]